MNVNNSKMFFLMNLKMTLSNIFMNNLKSLKDKKKSLNASSKIAKPTSLSKMLLSKCNFSRINSKIV